MPCLNQWGAKQKEKQKDSCAVNLVREGWRGFVRVEEIKECGQMRVTIMYYTHVFPGNLELSNVKFESQTTVTASSVFTNCLCFRCFQILFVNIYVINLDKTFENKIEVAYTNIHINTHLHACTHTHTCTNTPRTYTNLHLYTDIIHLDMHPHMDAHMHIHIQYTHMHKCTHTYTHSHMDKHMHVHTQEHIWMCANVHIHTYIYTHRHHEDNGLNLLNCKPDLIKYFPE